MNVTQDTLELIKQAQRNPDDDLAKTIASGAASSHTICRRQRKICIRSSPRSGM